jgi:hypothetical protein
MIFLLKNSKNEPSGFQITEDKEGKEGLLKSSVQEIMARRKNSTTPGFYCNF